MGHWQTTAAELEAAQYLLTAMLDGADTHRQSCHCSSKQLAQLSASLNSERISPESPLYQEIAFSRLGLLHGSAYDVTDP